MIELQAVYLRGSTCPQTPLFGIIPVVTLFVECAGAVIHTLTITPRLTSVNNIICFQLTGKFVVVSLKWMWHWIFNPLDGGGSYTAHQIICMVICTLSVDLRLVQREGAWAGSGTAHSRPQCTKCKSTRQQPVYRSLYVLLCDFDVPVKRLSKPSLGTPRSTNVASRPRLCSRYTKAKAKNVGIKAKG